MGRQILITKSDRALAEKIGLYTLININTETTPRAMGELLALKLEYATFAHCCGVEEICCQKLLERIRELNPQRKFNDAEILMLLVKIMLNSTTAIVLTDNRKNKILNALVPPKHLGVNPNSGKNLYMWVISREDYRLLKKYGKKKKTI